jgi:RNA polymerase sigma-70 factor (ECF subfamily)
VRSVDDAEDLVQETSLRWLQADTSTVRAPEGWLVAVITRLAIDRLRRAANEPRVHDDARNLGYAIASDRTMPEPLEDVATDVLEAFRLLRESLAPAERAAFVLRDVFACDYGELATMLGKSEAACRQVVHRARERVRRARSGLSLRGDDSSDLADRFRSALAVGDRLGVLAALGDSSADALRAA